MVSNLMLPKWLKWIIFIICAILAINFLETWGIIGVIIFLLSIILYRLYIGRKQIQVAMENIEIKLFGKPLHKSYWDKGELKTHKVRFVWKKKQSPSLKE